MEFYTRALQSLIEEFERLPGIGRKTAERLAYHVLRADKEEMLRLSEAIRDVKENVRHCRVCFNIAEAELCPICADPARDPGSICVIAEPKDLYAIEKAGSYRGRYHVLLGNLSPLDGVSPEDLTLDGLVARVREGGVSEVIVATNPTFEGDGTALHVAARLKEFPGVKVTRLARGMPSGSHLEHVSRTIVSDALEGRREFS